MKGLKFIGKNPSPTSDRWNSWWEFI